MTSAETIDDAEGDIRWVAIGDTWTEWDDTIFEEKREAMSVVVDEMLAAGAQPEDIQISTRIRHGEETTIIGYPLHDDINSWNVVYFWPATDA